jgi:hypothetical protein
MLITQREHLLKSMRDVLACGGNIAIYGWIKSNHSELTMLYEKTGRIRFFEKKTKTVSVSGDFVIMTPFINHTDKTKLKTTVPSLYPHPIHIGEIKSLLRECANLITKKVVHPSTSFKVAQETAGQLDINELEKQLILTEVLVVVDQFDTFASKFHELSTTHPEGLVSALLLSKILKGLEDFKYSSKKLIRLGWLIPVIRNGKRNVSMYRASEKLKARIQADNVEEPKDSIEKALFLRVKKPRLVRKIEKLQKEIEAIRADIARCEIAEQLLKQLEDL